MSVQRRLAEFVIDHRRAISLFTIVITAFMVFQLRHFKITLNARADLPPNDPEVAYYEQFSQLFHDRELLIVALEAKDIFTRENLSYLKTLTESLEKVEGVEQAISLANIAEIQSSGRSFTSRLFLERIPVSDEEMADRKKRAVSNPHWVRNIISPDGKVACVNVMLRSMGGDVGRRLEIVAAISRVLRREALPGVRVFMTGIAPLLSDSMDLVRSDLRRFLWLTPIMVMFLLWVMFRTVRGVMVSLNIILLSVILTFGLMFTAGKAVNVISTMLPTLIVVTCLSDLIYITAHYYEIAADLSDKREVLVRTMEHMIGPCFLTSLSAAAGFGSLVFSDLRSVRELGIYAACGVLIAYLLGITILPITLSGFALPPPSLQQQYDRAFTARILAVLVRFWERDKVWIPLLVSGCLVFSVIGIFRLKAETQISAFLPRSAPSVEGYSFIQEKMAGFSTLEMTLTGKPETFKEAWAIKEVDKIQRFLEGLPGVDTSLSLADFIKEFHKTMNGGSPQMYVVPERNDQIGEYLFLFSMTEHSDLLESFVSSDHAVARISARIRAMSTAGQLDLMHRVEEFAKHEMDSRLMFRTTGLVKLYATSVTALVTGQVRSLLVSCALISLLFVVRLKSLKAGLLVMVPNILPVLMTLGLMGYLGITLNLSTVMVSCIAIGFVVDDTIQILSRYRRELAANSEVIPAMRNTMLRAGRAYWFSSVVIAAGFSILAFSSFAPNRYLGILTAFTMLTALTADLVLTPFLVRIFRLR